VIVLPVSDKMKKRHKLYIYIRTGESESLLVTLLCPLCRSDNHRKEDWKPCDDAIISEAWNPEQSPKKFHMYWYKL